MRQRRPMAVVAEMDAAGQDGCHVLMTVAAHDRDLPVLLVIGDDPVLLGAIDAVEEIWQLSSVVKWPQLPGVGAVVDFLFRAGRKGGCMRLMSVVTARMLTRGRGHEPRQTVTGRALRAATA